MKKDVTLPLRKYYSWKCVLKIEFIFPLNRLNDFNIMYVLCWFSYNICLLKSFQISLNFPAYVHKSIWLNSLQPKVKMFREFVLCQNEINEKKTMNHFSHRLWIFKYSSLYLGICFTLTQRNWIFFGRKTTQHLMKPSIHKFCAFTL